MSKTSWSSWHQVAKLREDLKSGELSGKGRRRQVQRRVHSGTAAARFIAPASETFPLPFTIAKYKWRNRLAGVNDAVDVGSRVAGQGGEGFSMQVVAE